MTPTLKITALSGIVLLSLAAMAVPASAERLCLRFDNKSLVSTSDEGQDAYDRAAALGNRCFRNQARGGVTILPPPKADSRNGNDYYFLSRSQRELLHLAD
ncbi:hypothetical protein VW23_024680 [Devosia insulae DS-56]|uniref:Uncharacterized protein n=1 Tax=Devosia insulae DS-56 TaxID=1116389 RepID=A0A1E5XM96_9HYPH|nr:hypothetical protein [Devosia insulae]OEO29624.1 hypothetical protein VW23_024680 [Devosia insulae DS-56]